MYLELFLMQTHTSMLLSHCTVISKSSNHSLNICCLCFGFICIVCLNYVWKKNIFCHNMTKYVFFGIIYIYLVYIIY